MHNFFQDSNVTHTIHFLFARWQGSLYFLSKKLLMPNIPIVRLSNAPDASPSNLAISEQGIGRAYMLELAEVRDYESGLMFLRGLVDRIRPSQPGNILQAEDRIKALTHLLEDKIFRHSFSRIIWEIIDKADFTDFLIENGIPSESNFFPELLGRLRHKLIPALTTESSISYALNQVFRKHSDHVWVNGVSNEIWKDLFLNILVSPREVRLRLIDQVTHALEVLSCRIAFHGTESQIFRKSGKEEEWGNCFLEQQKELCRFVELLRNGEYDAECLRHAQVMLNQCRECLARIEKKSAVYGTSLHQSFLLRLIPIVIERVNRLADFINQSTLISHEAFTPFFKQSLKYEKTRNDILGFTSSSLSVLSYQIAEYKGRTGEHYITTNRKSYLRLFIASCKGGFIVSLMVVLKVLIGEAELPPIWEELLYSLNYSVGFVLIHITGSALATKQPAMTASAIAGAMDPKKDGGASLFQLVLIVARIFRSQTISFFGNLLLAFPFCVCWAFLFETLFGRSLINGGQAFHMLHEIQPFASFSFVFAALTGFFLFISGLVAGYADNKVFYGKLGMRLKRKYSPGRETEDNRRNRIIEYLEQNAGPVIGNVFLGFLLGVAGLMGYLFDIPYAIRHITFSTGNLAIALYELHFHLNSSYLLFCIGGVIGIGTFNFLSSFFFAFYIGVKSRNIDMKQYIRFSSLIIRYFFQKPWHFIFPPLTEPLDPDLVKQGGVSGGQTH